MLLDDRAAAVIPVGAAGTDVRVVADVYDDWLLSTPALLYALTW
jgi:bacteriorhodopsin